ncbi:MAG: ABC transporter substrate-binding protein [Ignisphaera sp.]|uniref:ABC transporter substrate-binding protein n=1 Tax=Ignisphaera aggregans TaxID=334771 RepID=A0A7C4JM71_9CREN
MKTKIAISLGIITLVVLLLMSILPIHLHAQVPGYPREETAIISQQWGTPSAFNPLIAGRYAWGVDILMYPRPFVYGPYSDDFIPYLATSFKWIDAYTLELTIKPDAYWWDGNPIKSSDVEWSFEIHKMCTTASSYIWNYLEDVVAVDDYTVRILVNKNNVNYFRLTDVLVWLILPKHRWEALYKEMGCKIATEFMDTEFDKIVGGGPYRPVYWEGDTWVYERVDNWWGKKYFGLPEPRYVMHIVPKSDEQVRLEWLQNNRDHMSHFVDRLWEIIKADPTKGTFDNKNCPPCMFGGSVVFFAFNLERYPFNDIRVRKALYYVMLANNMDALKKASEAAFSGYLMPPRLYPVPIIPMLERTERYLATDLIEAFLKEATIENAKKLLDEAGIIDRNGDGIRELPDGKDFKFSVIVPVGWVPVIGSATVFSDIWRRELGVIAEVLQLDFSVVWSRISQGDYEATWWLHSTRMGASSPWINFDVAMDSRLPTNPWSGPISRYKNPVADWILDEIGRTWDEGRRKDLFRLLQEIWLKDLPFLIFGQDPHWYQYSEKYWVGWPNTDRIQKYGAFYATNWDPAFVFVLFQVKSSKEVSPGADVDTVPEFLKPRNRIPASKFFEELEKVAVGPITVPATVTITITAPAVTPTTVTVTKAFTTTTTTVERVTDWTMTAVLAVVLFVVGFAISWFVKKK